MILFLIGLVIVNLVFLILIFVKKGNNRDSEKAIQEEIARNRQELNNSLSNFSNSIFSQITELSKLQNNQLQLGEQRLEKMRQTIENKLNDIQKDNSDKLELMRQVVDEKLHATLEKRLGESFQLVSERLEKVHQGLGEMQNLASGVGDLKKVLSNVKTRGIWGEILLGNLLEQILTPEQYSLNVPTKNNSQDRVEFAIKLPGKEKGVVWLPIDAKFPKEDYERLLVAQEQVNVDLVKECTKALEERIKTQAKDIRDKYIDPPNTTDFALMFLPTEGLFAEVLRIPGLFDLLQSKFKVIIAGPTTIAALLNSLQMGFRTLVIEKRTSEIRHLLLIVKAEFGKFGDLLEKTHKKLEEASHTIEDATVKSRTIEKKLKSVQELPSSEVTKYLDEPEEPKLPESE